MEDKTAEENAGHNCRIVIDINVNVKNEAESGNQAKIENIDVMEDHTNNNDEINVNVTSPRSGNQSKINQQKVTGGKADDNHVLDRLEASDSGLPVDLSQYETPPHSKNAAEATKKNKSVKSELKNIVSEESEIAAASEVGLDTAPSLGLDTAPSIGPDTVPSIGPDTVPSDPDRSNYGEVLASRIEADSKSNESLDYEDDSTWLRPKQEVPEVPEVNTPDVENQSRQGMETVENIHLMEDAQQSPAIGTMPMENKGISALVASAIAAMNEISGTYNQIHPTNKSQNRSKNRSLEKVDETSLKGSATKNLDSSEEKNIENTSNENNSATDKGLDHWTASDIAVVIPENKEEVVKTESLKKVKDLVGWIESKSALEKRESSNVVISGESMTQKVHFANSKQSIPEIIQSVERPANTGSIPAFSTVSDAIMEYIKEGQSSDNSPLNHGIWTASDLDVTTKSDDHEDQEKISQGVENPADTEEYHAPSLADDTVVENTNIKCQSSLDHWTASDFDITTKTDEVDKIIEDYLNESDIAVQTDPDPTGSSIESTIGGEVKLDEESNVSSSADSLMPKSLISDRPQTIDSIESTRGGSPLRPLSDNSIFNNEYKSSFDSLTKNVHFSDVPRTIDSIESTRGGSPLHLLSDETMLINGNHSSVDSFAKSVHFSDVPREDSVIPLSEDSLALYIKEHSSSSESLMPKSLTSDHPQTIDSIKSTRGGDSLRSALSDESLLINEMLNEKCRRNADESCENSEVPAEGSLQMCRCDEGNVKMLDSPKDQWKITRDFDCAFLLWHKKINSLRRSGAEQQSSSSSDQKTDGCRR